MYCRRKMERVTQAECLTCFTSNPQLMQLAGLRRMKCVEMHCGSKHRDSASNPTSPVFQLGHTQVCKAVCEALSVPPDQCQEVLQRELTKYHRGTTLTKRGENGTSSTQHHDHEVAP